LRYCSQKEGGQCKKLDISNTRKWADSPMR
jgi:hypothetical protein